MDIIITKPKTWLDELKQGLSESFTSFGNILNGIFGNKASHKFELTALLMEIVYCEIYEYRESNKIESTTLNEVLNDVTRELNKLTSASALIEFHDPIMEGSKKSAILKIKKGDEFTGQTRKINGIVKKYLDQPVDFDHLEAELQVVEGEANITNYDEAYQFLNLGINQLKWKWGISPKCRDLLVINVNVYRKNKKIRPDLRVTAWPSFTPPRITIEVDTSLRETISKLFKEPIFVTIVGGIVVGLILAILLQKLA